jgi:hypothetical protein
MSLVLRILLAVSLSVACGLGAEGVRMFSESFGCFDPGGRISRTASRISGTREYAELAEEEVYQDARVDTDGYLLKVPNGRYHAQLKFAEIEYDSGGRRVFGVKVQGVTVAERLDLFAKVGKNRAYQLKSQDVVVSDGRLRIEFVRIVGSPCIAAISVGGKIAGAEMTVQRVFYQHINCGGKGFRGYYGDFGF